MVKRGHMKKIILALILSGVFAVVIASIDSLTGSRLGPTLSNTPGIQYWGRFAGPLGHPNKLGYFLVISSILSLAMLRETNGKVRKFFWIVVFLLQVYGIYLSGSVTAFVGFILAFTALIFASFKKRTAPIKVFSGLMVVALIVISLGILSGNSTVLNVFQTLWDNIDRSINRVQLSTANSRMVIYQEALEEISESPFIGIGFDQISTSGTTNRLLDVHNVFIQIWYVGGILAFIGLLGIYVWQGISAIRILLQNHLGIHPHHVAALAAVALSVILMDQFQDALYQREKWLIFGLFSVYVWMTGKGVKEMLQNRRKAQIPVRAKGFQQ
jgi:O-antigen ligase